MCRAGPVQRGLALAKAARTGPQARGVALLDHVCVAYDIAINPGRVIQDCAGRRRLTRAAGAPAAAGRQWNSRPRREPHPPPHRLPPPPSAGGAARCAPGGCAAGGLWQ